MSLEMLLTALRGYTRPDDPELKRLNGNLAPETSVTIPTEYQQAVTDLLSGLGVLAANRQDFSSSTAYLFVQAVIHTLQDRAFTAAEWSGAPNDPCGGAGAALVRWLETHRLNCVADPAPIRRIRAVAAVIKARQDGEDVYLMQYDQEASQFQPLGGKIEAEDTSPEAALARELAEELEMEHLRLNVDYQLVPLRDGIHERSVSSSVHVLTEYYHSFYQMRGARFVPHLNRITRWITATELQRGLTNDGMKISTLIATRIEHLLAGLPYSFTDSV